MVGALATGGVVIALADIGLAIVSWRRRVVLGGLLATLGFALVIFAAVSGLQGAAAEASLAIAAVLLVVGTVLFGLGRAFDRLFADEPESEV